MIDGHVHVTAELLPYLQDVRCIANADCKAEYKFLRESGVLLISAGVHPWKADVTPWAEMEPILREVPVIGEIGLDSMWCSVDLEVQRAVFRCQLKLAMELQKPVILHTKGMEWEILETIRAYPNRYLVHWYACGEWLEAYIDLGCWFTVGPDVLSDEDVERLAKTVPIDRLLVESDGIEGVAWGQSREVSAADYLSIMQQHLKTVAKLRGMAAENLLRQMESNLNEFLYG